jgi:hypothetical protein
MRIGEIVTRKLCFQANDPWKNPGWVDYIWREDKGLWCYNDGSDNFHSRHRIPETFTEQERLLLEIRLADK